MLSLIISYWVCHCLFILQQISVPPFFFWWVLYFLKFLTQIWSICTRREYSLNKSQSAISQCFHHWTMLKTIDHTMQSRLCNISWTVWGRESRGGYKKSRKCWKSRELVIFCPGNCGVCNYIKISIDGFQNNNFTWSYQINKTTAYRHPTIT